MLLLVNREIMVVLLTANWDMCVCWCVSAGGVPELHQGAAGEWEQAVYLWNKRLHPHLHQPDGTNKFLKVPLYSLIFLLVSIMLFLFD